MEVLTKLRKVGGSLMVTVPKEIVDHESLHDGELVKIEIRKMKKSGFGMFPNLKPFTEKDRKEMWGDRF